MTEATGGAGAVAAHPGSGTREPRRRRVLRVLLGVVVLVLAVCGWLAFRGYQAATSLRAVADGFQSMQADVRAGRIDTLGESAGSIQRDAARAAAATSDPVWALAERLPVVGVDARAVRTVADALDGLATGALVPLASVAESLTPQAFAPVDGRIDTAPLVAAAPALRTAAAAVEDARRGVAALELDRLHGPLVEPVLELQTRLGTATDVLAKASGVADLLPPMLGAEGPRSYLVLFLNSAEVRTQGGIIGALAEIAANDGRLTLVSHAAAPDFPLWDEPVVPLTDAEVAVASDVVGRRIQNPVILPDTPRVGQITAEMWRKARGRTVDGVVVIDPVAISYLLGAIGDVRHPDGDVLTADTLVQTLLLDAYARPGSDAFFAGAASAAFAAVASGQGDPAEVVRALLRSADERRLSVWSAHPEEQKEILGTAVDGALLTGGHDDAVGVFLDNTSGWKTDTFLRTSVSLVSARCEAGTATIDLRLDLTSTVPAEVGALPEYVVGNGSTGVPPGTMRMRVSVYTAVGGTVEVVRRGDDFIGAASATMAGRQVQVMTETLPPGASSSYQFTLTAPAGSDPIPLWTTPTTTSAGLSSVATGCGAG